MKIFFQFKPKQDKTGWYGLPAKVTEFPTWDSAIAFCYQFCELTGYHVRICKCSGPGDSHKNHSGTYIDPPLIIEN